jgi:sulfur-oxidizing protein SoxX
MQKMKLLLSAMAALTIVAGSAGADELVKYQVVDSSIPKSLTGTPGDPANGEKVFVDRRLGNCLSCHQVTVLSKHPYHGEIGPSLDGVAERYNAGQLRMQVVNAKVINPDTIMPGFYRVEGLHRVLKQFAGKPILDAQQVEDVVAYLETLK